MEKTIICKDCGNKPPYPGLSSCSHCYYLRRKKQDQNYKKKNKNKIRILSRTYQNKKRYLLKGDIKSCEICGFSDHIQILQIHHIDRNRKNNFRENIKIICPNCHMWEHFITHSGPFSPNKYHRNIKELD